MNCTANRHGIVTTWTRLLGDLLALELWPRGALLARMTPRTYFTCGTAIVALIPGTLFFFGPGRILETLKMLAMIVVPTAAVAYVFSLWLIRPRKLAPMWQWVLAGILIPIISVIGFWETLYLVERITTGHEPLRYLYVLMVLVGSTVTVPFGVLGILVIRWLISRRFALRSDRSRLRWLTLATPLATLALIVGVYQYMFPSRYIPRALDRAAVETAYGEHLDAVVVLLSADDAERQLEIDRLHAVFEADRRVLRVSLEDPGLSYKSYGKTFFHLNTEAPPSMSCSGTVAPSQAGLIRCTWSYGALNRRDVLRYKRTFVHEQGSLEVIIELDYDEALTLARR